MKHPPSSSRTKRLAITVSAAMVAVPLFAVGLSSAPANSATTGNEIRPFEPGDEEVAVDAQSPKSNAPSHVPARNVPRVNGLPVTGATGVNASIEGLNFVDQRTSNNGNSFSVEPPDQGLCSGNGFQIEAVNNVFRVDHAGTTTAPQSLDPFWNNGTAEIIRHPDGTATFGPFISDPKCYFDPGSQRFFMTELQLSTDPATGDFTGDSFLNVAVSKSSVPTTNSTDWFINKLLTTNDGTQGTVSHPGCPCFGDQPLIGADANGFYVTTNEFSNDGSQFNGAQFYAFSKTSLVNGGFSAVRMEQVQPPLAEGIAYSVQPATSPSPAQWSTTNNGTEFFLSALEFTGGLDNRIAVWSLSNTASLDSANPSLTLSQRVIGSEVYGLPPKVVQKKGPTPLADSVKAKLELINSNDDRMNQVVFSNGLLWAGVNTVVKTHVTPTTTAIAYFVVSPTIDQSGNVGGHVSTQGYVAVNGNSTMFPSIGVTSGGGGVLVFTVAGKSFYPSAAVVHLSSTGALTSGVQIVRAGTKPDDGFSGYPAFGGAGVGRWGDYTAAVGDGDTVWVATEYIPGTNGFPFIGNWGTSVASITP